MFYVCKQKVQRTAINIVMLWETNVMSLFLYMYPFLFLTKNKNRHNKSSGYVQNSKCWDVTVTEGGQLAADQACQMMLKLCSISLVLDCIRSCQDCKTADTT